jgi:hypothetical protein
MAQERRRYRAYLLRLWWAGHDGEAGWRASLEEPHTGVRHGFATLEQLFAFLKEQADNSPNSDDASSDNRS